MKPLLSDDQEFFRATTARFLAEFSPTSVLRSLRDDPVGFSADYWRRGAELGWTSLLVSEANGGGSISGDGLVDLTLIAHEFGMSAAAGPLIPSNLVAAALSDANSHAEVLAGLLSGTTNAAWCGSEVVAGGRASGIQLRFDGGDVVLDGVLRPVESASVAEYFLVTGSSEEGLTQVLVPSSVDGISIETLQSVDLTRRFGVVSFNGARVAVSAVVGERFGAGAQFSQQVQTALVLSAAESVGAMQRGFDITLEWVLDRYSFGRPLGSYQAIKHRLADMKTWLEASHAIADSASVAVAKREPGAKEKASAAKAYVGFYGSELLHECVQLHGGLGVTYEHDIHLFLRRHTLGRTLFGTPMTHYRAIADNLADSLDVQEGSVA